MPSRCRSRSAARRLWSSPTRSRWGRDLPHRFRRGVGGGLEHLREGEEAFIHFSFESQVAGTAARYYAGVGGLVVLVVDPEGLDVRVENGFPHLYEPLPVGSVVEVRPLESFG